MKIMWTKLIKDKIVRENRNLLRKGHKETVLQLYREEAPKWGDGVYADMAGYFQSFMDVVKNGRGIFDQMAMTKLREECQDMCLPPLDDEEEDGGENLGYENEEDKAGFWSDEDYEDAENEDE
ncbi:hypothetical protein HDU96_002158 [Phlyctochytrium bullatum]|nr:hypothetical protein HDU96_002158 [Phlyctochytrium bullatum]